MSSRAVSWGSPVIFIVLAVGLLGVIGAATFLWFEIDRLEDRVTELEERGSSLARDIAEIEPQLTGLDARVALVSTALDAEGRNIRRELGQVSDLVNLLDLDLSDLADYTDQRFVDIGRCLYHEAEFNRYTYYWALAAAGRYVTGCD